MRLILARHGNTFGPDDKVSWVGSRNDLPLVASGIAQAQGAASALASIKIDAVYCAPLRRTVEFALIVAEAQNEPPPIIEDNRLTELDYGTWSGLTDDEIKETYGANTLSDWTEKSIFPQNCGWPARDEVIAQVLDFVAAVRAKYPQNANILAVSSNGRLRFFLKLIEGEFARRRTEKTFKVGTGRLGLIELSDEGDSVLLWNGKPDELQTLLCASSR